MKLKSLVAFVMIVGAGLVAGAVLAILGYVFRSLLFFSF